MSNPQKYGTEEETTENEFSEIDKAGQSSEIRNRVIHIYKYIYLYIRLYYII